MTMGYLCPATAVCVCVHPVVAFENVKYCRSLSISIGMLLPFLSGQFEIDALYGYY